MQLTRVRTINYHFRSDLANVISAANATHRRGAQTIALALRLVCVSSELYRWLRLEALSLIHKYTSTYITNNNLQLVCGNSISLASERASDIEAAFGSFGSV